MTGFSKRSLFWAPRVLSISYFLFWSIFALVGFFGHDSFWLINKIPTTSIAPLGRVVLCLFVAALILAWRWECIGALLYTALGFLNITSLMFMQYGGPPAERPGIILIIGGLPFVIAGLFLANWLKRGELRGTWP